MVGLCGINLPDERRLHIATAVYYDGTHDSECKEALTLTGIAAPQGTWGDFEADWGAALVKNHVYEPLHMRELMHNKGYFADFGWEEKIKLIGDLWNVFGKYRPTRMCAYSCTVMLADYQRAKSQIPNLRPPESICVDYSVGGLQLTSEELSISKPLLLYFDRSERFMCKIYRTWNRATKNGTYFGSRVGWPFRIRNIFPADRSYRPIQAADLLAWSINRAHCTGDDIGNNFALSALLMIKHLTRVYEYEDIVREYPNG